jgi:hypothetical protein
MSAVLRDKRIGRLLAARGCRALEQGSKGNGTELDNVVRIAEWRNRYALVSVEEKIQPVRKTANR